MDVPKQVHDIPRPRLFENTGLHPFSDLEELDGIEDDAAENHLDDAFRTKVLHS